MITTKSRSELEIMREAGRIVAEVHKGMKELIRPGVTTWDLDAWAESKIRSYKAIPTFKGYRQFPATLCTSVNEVVVHGIPSKKVKLKEGDIIGVDCGVTYRGYVGDSAWTYTVGAVKPEVKKLLEVTEASMWNGIQAVKVGARIQDVGIAVENTVNPHRYGIVRDFCGHGVGTNLHEDPQVPNYINNDSNDKSLKMRVGLCIAIEPMINMGTWQTRILRDGWTVVTTDGKHSAHFEHTVACTAEGPLILTALDDEVAFKFLPSRTF